MCRWGPLVALPVTLSACGLPADWIDIAVSADVVCAEHANGTWVCPTFEGVDEVPPSAGYLSVAVNLYPCGVRATDGAVECWGANAPAAVPIGPFTQVLRPMLDLCGIDTEGGLACVDELGQPVDAQFEIPVQGGDQNGDNLLALTADGDAVYQALEYPDTRQVWSDGRPVKSVSYGGDASWVYEDGSMHVWFLDEEPQGVVQGEAGANYACGIDVEHVLTCYAKGYREPGEPPEGEFTLVRVADNTSCAIRTNGRLVCWGDFAGFSTLSDIAELWHP